LPAIVSVLPAGLPASTARERQMSIGFSMFAALRHHRSKDNVTRCGMIVKRFLTHCGKNDGNHLC
jgi:hypothetical protein